MVIFQGSSYFKSKKKSYITVRPINFNNHAFQFLALHHHHHLCSIQTIGIIATTRWLCDLHEHFLCIYIRWFVCTKNFSSACKKRGHEMRVYFLEWMKRRMDFWKKDLWVIVCWIGIVWDGWWWLVYWQ